jgi:XTP/dITP diphosphohydrolase
MSGQTWVLAGHNPHKQAAFRALASRWGMTVLPQADFARDSVIEDGQTFVENALKKARLASEVSGLPALADDTGLVVPALQGAPGLYTARFAECFNGQESNDENNRQALLSQMSGLPFGQRDAYLTTTLVWIASPSDPEPKVVSARWQGEILMQCRTPEGVGYDPIFWLPQHLKTPSEMALTEKHRLDQRARAFEQLMTLF